MENKMMQIIMQDSGINLHLQAYNSQHPETKKTTHIGKGVFIGRICVHTLVYCVHAEAKCVRIHVMLLCLKAC